MRINYYGIWLIKKLRVGNIRPFESYYFVSLCIKPHTSAFVNVISNIDLLL